MNVDERGLCLRQIEAEIGCFARTLQENQDRNQGTAGYCRVVERDEKRTSGDHAAKQSLRIGATEDVRQAMWEKHLQSLVSALGEAMRRREAGRERPGSSSAGGSTVLAFFLAEWVRDLVCAVRRAVFCFA